MESTQELVSIERPINNPFISKSNEIQFGDKIYSINKLNIGRFFKKIFAICLMKNKPLTSPNIYKKYIDKKELESIKYDLVLVEVPHKILKSKNMFFSIVNSCDVEMFNHFGLELFDRIVIVPIFNISYLNLKSYIDLHYEGNRLDDLFKNLILSEHFNMKGNYNNLIYMTDFIKNLEGTKYWKKQFYCDYTITESFSKRKFYINSSKYKKEEKKALEKTTAKQTHEITDYMANMQITQDKTKQNISDYLAVMQDQPPLPKQESNKESKTDSKTDSKDEPRTKRNNYTSISSSLEKSKFRRYRLNMKPCRYTRENMNYLFDNLNDIQKYYLFSNLLISKKYCHLVINNSHVLDVMKENMTFYAHLYRYLIGYSMLCFHFEESVYKTFIKKDNDYVFDINTASKLPIYPYSHKYPKLNPYLPILVSDEELDTENNLWGFPYYMSTKELQPKGISTYNEFLLKANIFITGCNFINIFNNLDDDINIGVTGSLMTACLQKEHPLENIFYFGDLRFNSNLDISTVKFNTFLNEYYKESDVDVVVCSNDQIDFIKKCNKIFTCVVGNLLIWNEGMDTNNVRSEVVKTYFLSIDDNIIRDVLTDYDKDYVYNNLGDENIKTIIKEYYKDEIAKENEKLVSNYLDDLNNLDPRIFNDDDALFEVRIRNEYQINNPYITKVNISFKYNIKSPAYLNRNLELFATYKDDPFAIVARFHMPCVRGYWSGKDVYLLPSCVMSHMTLMNIDYKYFSGKKDPIDIINKYRMRGFGTFLNKQEIRDLLIYSKETKWNNLLFIEDSEDIVERNKQILGHTSITQVIHRPNMVNPSGYPNMVEYNRDHDNKDKNGNLINSVKEYQVAVNELYKISGKEDDIMYNYTTVNESGSINMVNNIIIEQYFNNKISEYKEHYYDEKYSEDEKNEKDEVVINFIPIQQNTVTNTETDGVLLDSDSDITEEEVSQLNNQPVTINGTLEFDDDSEDSDEEGTVYDSMSEDEDEQPIMEEVE